MSKPSLGYRIAAFVIGHIGMKNMWGLPKNELIAKCEKINAKRPFKMPADKKAVYEDHIIEGKYHLLEIRQANDRRERAILYIYGGGMLTAADSSDTGSARKLGKLCGQDIWFPFYPLITDHSVTDLMTMVLDSYNEMLHYYKPENITVYGYSSGAATGIGILQLINHGIYGQRETRPPMPGKLVALSPGSVPYTDEEQAEMDKYTDVDVMLPASFIQTIKSFLEDKDEPTPDWLMNAANGNYTDFPETWFYYGGAEVLRGAAPYYEKAFERDGAIAHFTIEPGMCHCYAMLDAFRDTRKAYNEIVDIIQKQ